MPSLNKRIIFLKNVQIKIQTWFLKKFSFNLNSLTISVSLFGLFKYYNFHLKNLFQFIN
jgi:hypothetical protein